MCHYSASDTLCFFADISYSMQGKSAVMRLVNGHSLHLMLVILIKERLRVCGW